MSADCEKLLAMLQDIREGLWPAAPDINNTYTYTWSAVGIAGGGVVGNTATTLAVPLDPSLGRFWQFHSTVRTGIVFFNAKERQFTKPEAIAGQIQPPQQGSFFEIPPFSTQRFRLLPHQNAFYAFDVEGLSTQTSGDYFTWAPASWERRGQ